MATKMVAQSINLAGDEVLIFDRYQLDTRRRVLRENGRRVKLGSRGLSILIVLAQRGGQMVTKRELLSHIWPGAFVEDATLRVHISALQRTLGKSEWGGRFVENIFGQGYRLAEPVFCAHRSPTAGVATPIPLERTDHSHLTVSANSDGQTALAQAKFLAVT